ncbi:MAG: argininosuccinate lyase [Pyrinomonadaceae bacterium]
MSDTKNLWGGRFRDKADNAFAAFNSSFSFDRRLFQVDVRASIAYCRALAGAGVITAAEAEQITTGLDTVLQESQDRQYFDDVVAEDIHSFVEARLIELIGEPARKLHTGRSRNDQVATDLRLWVRDAIQLLQGSVTEAQRALLDFAEANRNLVIPGYTHLQRAQPVLLAHWCLAYFEMLVRDVERFKDLGKRVDVLPLGSAALAGTSFPVDREQLARTLGFAAVSRNSMDAVSDRDFCLEFLSACSIVMIHLSRLAEDIILYASAEFGFFELSDAVATGSSLMPQKKNPDSMELVRGKAGRVFGNEQALLTTLKGLALTYNKDLQEDKEAVFDSFDTVNACLQITATVLRNVGVNEQRAKLSVTSGFMNATELADYLVRKGMPFRDAHDVAGKIVLLAIQQNVEIERLTLEDMKTVSSLISSDIFEVLTLERTLESKGTAGGTSRECVANELQQAHLRINE